MFVCVPTDAAYTLMLPDVQTAAVSMPISGVAYMFVLPSDVGLNRVIIHDRCCLLVASDVVERCCRCRRRPRCRRVRSVSKTRSRYMQMWRLMQTGSRVRIWTRINTNHNGAYWRHGECICVCWSVSYADREAKRWNENQMVQHIPNIHRLE